MFRRRRRSAQDEPAEELEALEDAGDGEESDRPARARNAKAGKGGNAGKAGKAASAATGDDEDEDEDDLHRPLPPAPRPDGPWDVDEVDEPGQGRIDLGGLFVPAREGMELRVEVSNDLIVAATVILDDSAVQLQAFAAPRSEGLWHEIRGEIASGVTQQGGVVDEIDGGLGWELRAQVPVQLPDGTQGAQLIRFVGCDGPRWFLRGVISGKAAVHPETGGELERLFRETVVVRGTDPMAPRDPILLRLPDNAKMDPAGGAAGDAGRFQGEDLNPFQRGPEITEVR